jgi:hypothetical protein
MGLEVALELFEETGPEVAAEPGGSDFVAALGGVEVGPDLAADLSPAEPSDAEPGGAGVGSKLLDWAGKISDVGGAVGTVATANERPRAGQNVRMRPSRGARHGGRTLFLVQSSPDTNIIARRRAGVRGRCYFPDGRRGWPASC